MIQSILIYTFIIVVMLFFAIVSKQNSKYKINANGELIKIGTFWKPEIIFMIFFFSIMFGIRYDVGADHLSYLETYIQGDKHEINRYEFIFRSITLLFYNNNIHPIIYFSLWSFIQILFFLRTFKNEFYLFPLLVFFLFFNVEYLFWMNGIRQALAMCIWLYSTNYIIKNKIFNYYLYGIISILFHKSAIILVVFYPILKNRKDYFKNIRLQLILYMIAIIIKKFIGDIILRLESHINRIQTLFNGYDSYTMEKMTSELEREVSSSGLIVLYKSILWLVIILYSNKLKSYYKSNKFNIIYFFFFISVFIGLAIPSNAVILTRPFRYFLIFKTIMLAYFCYYLFKDNTIRYNKLLAYFIIISFICMFYLFLITQTENSSIWYKFYFLET